MKAFADAVPPDVALRTPDDAITVLAVAPTADGAVARALAPDDRFDHRTAAPDDADLGDVDCVVASDPPDASGLLERTRRTRPALPFVLFAADAPTAVVESVLSDSWTGYVPKDADAAAELLRHRVREIVADRRTAALLRRVLAGVETSRDGVAVTGRDGEFEYVSKAFAARFDRAPDALLGTPWREVYAPAGRARIEDAAPALSEGWRWTGDCEARRASGESFTVRTSVFGLDDGSLAFVVHDAPPVED